MILVGSPVLTAQRESILRTGVVMGILPGDTVHELWLGNGPGVDYLGVTCSDPNGTRFVFARLRIHMDDKLFSSEDVKDVVQIAFGPEIPWPVWSRVCRQTREAARAAGLLVKVKLVEVDDSYEKFLEVLQVEGQAFGFDVSIAKFDSPPRQRRRF